MHGAADVAGDIEAGAEGADPAGVTEAGAASWRPAVRRFLIEHAQQPPVSFGEFVDQLSPLVPAYEAPRHWARRLGKRPARQVAPARQMQALLQHEASRYPLELHGAAALKGKQAWTRDVRFRAIEGKCAGCGKPFVGQKGVMSCSQVCGTKAGWERIKANRQAAIEQEVAGQVAAKLAAMTVPANGEDHAEPLALSAPMIPATVPMAPPAATLDREIAAMQALLELLGPLPEAMRLRVLGWAACRYS